MKTDARSHAPVQRKVIRWPAACCIRSWSSSTCPWASSSGPSWCRRSSSKRQRRRKCLRRRVCQHVDLTQLHRDSPLQLQSAFLYIFKFSVSLFFFCPVWNSNVTKCNKSTIWESWSACSFTGKRKTVSRFNVLQLSLTVTIITVWIDYLLFFF